MNIIRDRKLEIMQEWQELVIKAIPAAKNQSHLALYNSLPDFLENLATLLDQENNSQNNVADLKSDLIGKVHGQHRANSCYGIDQMIDEYFILKDVVLKVLEENGGLDASVQNKINYSFQKTLQVSTAQFSKSLLDSQENFVLSLAHDLRSPLMAIRMQSELMIRKKEYKEETCQKIIRSVDKIDKMIDHLLSSIKSQHSGMSYLDADHFDLCTVVNDVVNEYNELYPDTIQVKCDPTIVKWNQHSIERVIDNLISNALKYGDTTKPVTIDVETDEFNVFFSIHNFGHPISKKDQLTLFQKFKRTEDTKDKKGWGIGLSYVKAVVEAHKGIVLVNSDEGGTSFKFEVPRDIDLARELSLETARDNEPNEYLN